VTCLRGRRRHHDHRRQPGEPDHVPQAARRADRWGRLSHAAAAGPGQLGRSHRHRRGLRADVVGETTYAADLIRSLRAPGCSCSPTGLRLRSPGPQDRGGGSGLPDPRHVPVRVIDATWTVTTSAGRYASDCRLVTTLTDAAHFPAPSKCNARGKIDRATYKATIDIAVLTADLPANDEP
jgi:hypothetical protein